MSTVRYACVCTIMPLSNRSALAVAVCSHNHVGGEDLQIAARLSCDVSRQSLLVVSSMYPFQNVAVAR
jgi:hypothetical protein